MATRSVVTKLRQATNVSLRRCSPPISLSSQPQFRTLSSHQQFHKNNDWNDQKGGNHSQKFSFSKMAALGMLSGVAALYTLDRKATSHSLLAAETEIKKGNVSSRRNHFNFIADVVETSGSAVVYIERLGRIPFSSHRVPISHGSGFIVESDGLIITNAHVVGNQSRLKVRLQDGREFQGEVLGVDEGLDLAAVKIPCKNLPHLTLGYSSEIRPGEWVVAMGSPLNLKNTVTAGIVSNINRAGKELGLRDYEKQEMEYIQTDAMINVGNSGGPLINLDVEVIGVNSMMASAGIGFAIPVDYVKDFLERLKRAMRGRRGSKSEESTRPERRRYIGITMLTLTEDIATQLRHRDPGFPNVKRGVLVHRVQYNSPADKGGIQDGDIIVGINGREICSPQDVFKALRDCNAIEVIVRRGDKTVVLRVVPEDVF